MKTVAELGERELLRRIQQLLDRPRDDVLLGIGDDGAILNPGTPVVATVDSIVAGTDWLPDRTPRASIGHRAVAINLSDLAAMGARPTWLLLALELPPDLPLDDLETSLQRAAELAQAHGATVVGGDVGIGEGTERWTVTALGSLIGRATLRSAAGPGDRLWLVGEVGAAAVGLAALRVGASLAGLRRCVDAHLEPRPQVEAGCALAASPHKLAAIDVSDGLWLDGSRLARASDVGLRVELPRPDWLSDEVAAFCQHEHIDWRLACAGGGDDYALLVSAPPDVELDAFLQAQLPDKVRPKVTRAGRVVPAAAGVVVSIDGQELTGSPQGYEHGRH